MHYHILLHTLSHNFHGKSSNLTQFGLFQPFLGKFQHVGYPKAFTQSDKFIVGTGRGGSPKKEPRATKKKPKAYIGV